MIYSYVARAAGKAGLVTTFCLFVWAFNNRAYAQSFSFAHTQYGQVWAADDDGNEPDEDFIWVFNTDDFHYNVTSETMRLNERGALKLTGTKSGLYYTASGNAADGLPNARLTENWGMRFSAPSSRWVLSTGPSLLVGYSPSGEDWGTGNVLVQNNVGIGTTTPALQLDIRGTKGLGFTNPGANGTLNDHIYLSHTGKTATMRAGGADSGLALQVANGSSGGYGQQTYVEGMRILPNGHVGIGTTNPDKGVLHIKGSFHVESDSFQVFHVSAKKALVFVGKTAYTNYQQDSANANGVINQNKYSLWVSDGIVSENYAVANVSAWSDYVFNRDYPLASLEKLEEYIKVNKHLPAIPSEEEVKRNGYNMVKLNNGFLKTMEELTLYAIDQEKKIKGLNERMNNMEEELAALKKLITAGATKN